jgi:two-component system sensor histidine kinase KdpD
VAVGCLDYFFAPPIHSFRVADPKNWVALLTFEIIALIVSRLSARLRNEMRESLLHRGNAEKLYELSRSILILDRRRPVGPQIACLIEKHIGLHSVAIFDGSTAELFTAGACTKEDEELARTTFLLNGSYDTREPAKWNRVLRLQSRPTGAIVMSAVDLNPLMVDAIASLVAIAVERLRSFENESRVEAARQAEQLRTTVLDGLAHAFKTPLTVILTSTSGLCEMKCLAPAQAQLVQLIDEHASQLNALTSHMLQMAKLDTKEIHLRREEVFIGPFIKQLVDDCAGQLGGHAVPICIEDEDLYVSADRQLLGITITELLLNAAKYSNADSPISISARNENRHAVISVHNDGPVIELAETELIFARFYRSAITKHRASGNGIGLSVARRTAQAHDGRIWVNSSPETGTTFFLSLPALARGEYADVTE